MAQCQTFIVGWFARRSWNNDNKWRTLETHDLCPSEAVSSPHLKGIQRVTTNVLQSNEAGHADTVIRLQDGLQK
jgi:hypothetical protein